MNLSRADLLAAVNEFDVDPATRLVLIAAVNIISQKQLAAFGEVAGQALEAVQAGDVDRMHDVLIAAGLPAKWVSEIERHVRTHPDRE